jgi:hypothetical protein
MKKILTHQYFHGLAAAMLLSVITPPSQNIAQAASLFADASRSTCTTPIVQPQRLIKLSFLLSNPNPGLPAQHRGSVSFIVPVASACELKCSMSILSVTT